MITGPPWCFHIHEPAVDGDLDVRRLCLHRRQHCPLPCQQVRCKKIDIYQKILKNHQNCFNGYYVLYFEIDLTFK